MTMAAVGADGLTDLYTGPSVDAKGLVAFTGVMSGQSVFVADGVSAPVRLHASGTSRVFTDGPQMGGNKQVAASDRFSSSGYYFRIWDGNSPGNYQLVAQNGTFNRSSLTSIAGFPAISADGSRVAFVGARSSTSFSLFTGSAPPYGEISVGSAAVRPMVANDGSVVYGRQGSSGPVIILSDYTFGNSQIIANNSNFTTLGLRPGISDSGKVVVFYGEPTAAGAAAIGTNPGPGIFASIPASGGGRRIIRIAGRQIEQSTTPVLNSDGICDPTETCGPGEFGFDEGANPRTFTSFLDTSRVAVIHQELGRPGLVDDTLVVTFMGTPSAPLNSGIYKQSLGIWSVRVDLYDRTTGRIEDAAPSGPPPNPNDDVLEKPFQPRPVIQVGDQLGDRIITALSVLNDPIAPVEVNPNGTMRLPRRGDHWIAYQANTNAGLIIVRATATDSDGDTLLDHWERDGIDFDQDGVIDLDLPNPKTFKADMWTKDVYLEIDYMRAADHDHRPHQARLNQVINEFANNNVALHVLVDDLDTVGEVTPLQFNSNAGNLPANGRFDLIKLGGNPMALCGTGAGVGAFGTTGIRGDANCDKVQRARLLVYRYMLIGHQISHPAFPQGYGGAAELGGDDIFIAAGTTADPTRRDFFKLVFGNAQLCQPTEGPAACGYWTALTDLMMHELGHTLGLRHGGDEDYNCKPNYRSVMSYSLLYRFYDGARERTFSGARLYDLNEFSLDENVGIGSVGNGYIVFGDSSGTPHVAPWNVSVDWNLSGGPPVDVNVQADLNHIRDVQCPGNGFVLRGFDDWSNLFRQQFGHYRAVTQWSNAEPPMQELLETEVVQAVQDLDSDGDGINNPQDNCPFAANPSQQDSDTDEIGDACEPSTAVPDISVTATATPEPVALNELLTVDVTVSNDGSWTSQRVLLEYSLPDGVSVEAVMTSKGTCEKRGLRYVCKLGDVAVAEDVSLQFQMRPQQAVPLEHAFSLSSGSFEVNEANNTARVTGTVN